MLIFKLHDYTTHFYIISDAILSGTNTSRDISIVMNNCKKYVNYLEAHIRNFNFEKIHHGASNRGTFCSTNCWDRIHAGKSRLGAAIGAAAVIKRFKSAI